MALVTTTNKEVVLTFRDSDQAKDIMVAVDKTQAMLKDIQEWFERSTESNKTYYSIIKYIHTGKNRDSTKLFIRDVDPTKADVRSYFWPSYVNVTPATISEHLPTMSGSITIRGTTVALADIARVLASILDADTRYISENSSNTLETVAISSALTDLFFGVLESPKLTQIAYVPMNLLASPMFQALDALSTWDTDNQGFLSQDAAATSQRSVRRAKQVMSDAHKQQIGLHVYQTYMARHDNPHAPSSPNVSELVPPPTYSMLKLPRSPISPMWPLTAVTEGDTLKMSPKCMFFFLSVDEKWVNTNMAPPFRPMTSGTPNTLVWITVPLIGQLTAFIWTFKDSTIVSANEDANVNNSDAVCKSVAMLLNTLNGTFIQFNGTPIVIDVVSMMISQKIFVGNDRYKLPLGTNFRSNQLGFICHGIALKLFRKHNEFFNDAKKPTSVSQLIHRYSESVIKASTREVLNEVLLSRDYMRQLVDTFVHPLAILLQMPTTKAGLVV